MAYSTQELGKLFGAAVQTLNDNRTKINELDGHNGNHGDNMVHNLQVIQRALQSHGNQTPAEALTGAAKVLQAEGKGGTSQHYAKGLTEAAARLVGKQSLNNDDVSSLVQTLLGSVPAGQASTASSTGQPSHKPHVKPVIGAEPAQPQPSAPSDDLLGSLGSLLGGQSAPQSTPAGAGSILDLLGGLGGGQATQSTNQPGLDMGDVLNAGLAFFQAQQSGADTGTAAMQAFQAAMSGNDPLQSGSPRAAAGGLIAQTILGMLTGGK
jgi:hypothetical protein